MSPRLAVQAFAWISSDLNVASTLKRAITASPSPSVPVRRNTKRINILEKDWPLAGVLNQRCACDDVRRATCNCRSLSIRERWSTQQMAVCEGLAWKAYGCTSSTQARCSPVPAYLSRHDLSQSVPGAGCGRHLDKRQRNKNQGQHHARQQSLESSCYLRSTRTDSPVDGSVTVKKPCDERNLNDVSHAPLPSATWDPSETQLMIAGSLQTLLSPASSPNVS